MATRASTSSTYKCPVESTVSAGGSFARPAHTATAILLFQPKRLNRANAPQQNPLSHLHTIHRGSPAPHIFIPSCDNVQGPPQHARCAEDRYRSSRAHAWAPPVHCGQRGIPPYVYASIRRVYQVQSAEQRPAGRGGGEAGNNKRAPAASMSSSPLNIAAGTAGLHSTPAGEHPTMTSTAQNNSTV